LSVTTDRDLADLFTPLDSLSFILPPSMLQTGVVGVPVPSIEAKLVDFPDANYFSTNSPPQGEVWIRGGSISKGYFKRDDVTAEAFTNDGWLKTGDIGQWNADGTLSIIDRKKNLVKLAGGEYIALERLESIYKSCGLVSNICLVADSNANKPMAVSTASYSRLMVLPLTSPSSQIVFPRSWSSFSRSMALN
jgi:long-chain acyl-CoA synthetase